MGDVENKWSQMQFALIRIVQYLKVGSFQTAEPPQKKKKSSLCG